MVRNHSLTTHCPNRGVGFIDAGADNLKKQWDCGVYTREKSHHRKIEQGSGRKYFYRVKIGYPIMIIFWLAFPMKWLGQQMCWIVLQSYNYLIQSLSLSLSLSLSSYKNSGLDAIV